MKSTFFRHFRFVNACLIVVAVGGCIEVGGSDEEGGDESGDCESDSDCDDDEICNDGDCEPSGSGGTNAGGASTGGRSGSSTGGGTTGGASTGGASSGGASSGGANTGGSGGGPTDTCGIYCDFSLRCGGENSAECLSACDGIYVVGGACAMTLDALSSCIRAYGPDCDAIGSSCSEPAQGVIASCSDEPCPFTNDDECDEPEGTGYCREGTDAADCTGCGFTLDGDCDEPEGLNLCPEGSDVIDCGCPEGMAGNTCEYSCDAVCDQPDYCETGTDEYDCANYP